VAKLEELSKIVIETGMTAVARISGAREEKLRPLLIASGHKFSV
jgi:hypothetical protein